MADLLASEAKAWMVKAWRDLETARRAAGGVPPFYDIAVYHCQQAAEKAVKHSSFTTANLTRKPTTSKC